MEERVHVVFSGRVQGVGFRFSARSLARRRGIKGWVKNLIDGRVELLAQEEPKLLIEFLEELRQEFKGYIRREELEWQKAERDLDSFHVAY